MNPRRLFLLWVGFTIGAFTIPRFFAPPDGVDLAPLAGLIGLALFLAALVVAIAAFVHSLQRRRDLDSASMLAGTLPLIISGIGIALVVASIQ